MSVRYLALGALGLAVWGGGQSAEVDQSAVTRTEVERTALDSTEQARAQLWGLSEEEWRRYRSLMQGVRGAVSISTISPIEVLGIHARDEAERRRYAERWAQVMHEDAEQVLAFNRAYFEAFRRLYPNAPMFDPARLAALRQPAPAAALRSGDRLVLFAGLTDCPRCAPLATRLVEAAGRDRGIGVDIYLVGAVPGEGGDAAIRAWARQLNIPRDLVERRAVTLNHDGGLLRQWGPAAQVPYLLRRRGAETRPVTLTELGL